MINDNASWSIAISSDYILNFIVYIGCTYGLIDKNKYNKKEILWPQKSLNTSANSDNWEEWFTDIVNVEVERVKAGKPPYTIIEEFKPPEFLNVKCNMLKECCKEVWPEFIDWWYMLAGGKNALSFLEGMISNKLSNYVKEFKTRIGRELKPFKLYINLLYSGLSETIEISIDNNQYIIITSDPLSYFNEEWWIKKLYEIG